MPNSPALVLALTAHFIGDYYLQWQNLADKKKGDIPALLLHGLLYALPFALMFLLVELPWWAWLVLVGSHLLIDSLKWVTDRMPALTEDKLFLLDQFSHLALITILFVFLPQLIYRPPFESLKPEFWRWLLVFVLIGKPANVSFKAIFGRFSQGVNDLSIVRMTTQRDSAEVSITSESKPGAGAWIGVLERIFVVIFSAASQYAAFGLLMTAKSVARYEKISKDPAFAEYYLIGTLYSVLFALAAYLLVFQVIWPLPVVLNPTPILLVTPTP
jgi:hypothetical protein